MEGAPAEIYRKIFWRIISDIRGGFHRVQENSRDSHKDKGEEDEGEGYEGEKDEDDKNNDEDGGYKKLGRR